MALFQVSCLGFFGFAETADRQTRQQKKNRIRGFMRENGVEREYIEIVLFDTDREFGHRGTFFLRILQFHRKPFNHFLSPIEKGGDGSLPLQTIQDVFAGRGFQFDFLTLQAFRTFMESKTNGVATAGGRRLVL